MRPFMLGLTGPIMSLGLLTVYGVGDLLNWRLVAAVSTLVPVIMSLCSWSVNMSSS